MSRAPRSLLPWLKSGIVVVLAAVFLYIVSVPALFLPFIAAIVLDSALAPFVSALERRDWLHRHAVMVVFLGFAAALALFLAVVPRFAAAEAATIKTMWPESRPRLTALLQDTEAVVNRWLPEGGRLDLVSGVPDRAQAWALSAIAAAPASMPDVLMALFLVPLFTFFLMRDGPELKRAIVASVPNRYFEMALSILYKVNRQVSNYLRGLLAEAGFDTFIASSLCAAFGVPNPLLIGILVGTTAVIPLAGVVFASIAGPLIAVFSTTGDPVTTAGLTLLAIVITHTLDNVLVAPLVIGHSVDMHPIVVIVSVLVAGRLFGVLGIVLAVPVTSIVTVIAQEGYRGLKANEYFLKHT
jgi:putative permease